MAITKDYVTDYWQGLCEQLAGDLPWPRLRAWIAEESGGFPQALGAITEVGIFQVDLQDGPKYGGTTATLHTNFCASASSQQRVRDLTDDEERLQVTSGVAMVTEYLTDAQSRLDAANLQWSDDDLWSFTKLHHGLPSLKYLLAKAADAGRANDWDDFRAWSTDLNSDDVTTYIGANSVRYMPFSRFFDNAEAVGYLDGGGLVGGGGLSAMGKALVAVAILFGVLYYGSRHGLV